MAQEAFSLITSRGFESWLHQSGGAIAFTTYQAGKARGCEIVKLGGRFLWASGAIYSRATWRSLISRRELDPLDTVDRCKA